MNDSTHRFVRNNLKRLNRVRLLRLGTKLYCSECNTLRSVTDFFNGSDVVVLDCKHRRSAFNRTEQERAAFEQADHEREVRREIVGYAAPTAGGLIRHYVENVEGVDVEIEGFDKPEVRKVDSCSTC